MPTATLSPLPLLLLLLSSASAFFTVNNATSELDAYIYFNHDIPTASWHWYNITGAPLMVNFTDAVHCELSSTTIGVGEVAVIDLAWGLTEGNCTSIAQIAKQIFPKLNTRFAVLLSGLDLYQFGYPHMEAYGDVENVTDVVVTLAVHDVAFVLSEIVSFTVISDTNKFVDIIYPPSFIAYQVIFAGIYIIAILCLTVELGYVLYHGEFQVIRLVTFFCVWYFCASRIIEIAVDPFRSTDLLGYVGHDFIWWSGFFSDFSGFVCLTFGWLHVAGPAISKSHTKQVVKAARYLLIFSDVLVLIVAILTIAKSSFPKTGWISDLTMAVYGLLVIALCLIMPILFISGAKIVAVLKVFKDQGRADRVVVIRRFSFIMWGLFVGFVIYVVAVLLVLIVYIDDNASDKRVYASITNHVMLDIGGYIMVFSVIYGLNPFRNYFKQASSMTDSQPGTKGKSNTNTQISLTDLYNQE